MEEFGADSIEAITITEAVVRRPKMWTVGGTLEEVIAFLEGYTVAISHLEKVPKKKPLPKDALSWLEKKSEIQVIRPSYSEVLEALRKKYSNDENILKELSDHLKIIREGT